MGKHRGRAARRKLLRALSPPSLSHPLCPPQDRCNSVRVTAEPQCLHPHQRSRVGISQCSPGECPPLPSASLPFLAPGSVNLTEGEGQDTSTAQPEAAGDGSGPKPSSGRSSELRVRFKAPSPRTSINDAPPL